MKTTGRGALAWTAGFGPEAAGASGSASLPATAGPRRGKREKREMGEPANPVLVEKELACDVLVVGMGFAGLVTALRALELGAKVIAIDKHPRDWWTPGGNMVISGFSLHLASPSVGLEAPEAELVEAITNDTGGMIPPDLLAVTVRNAGRAQKWLIENGAEFEEPPGKQKHFKPGRTTSVWGRIKPGGIRDSANSGGKKLALKLESNIKERGGSLLYETKAIKLLTNARREVIGVMAQDTDGLFNIKAKAVVLCTGGYERNNEMLVKYVGPHADEIVRYCGPGCTGDGIKMGEELGAYLRSMNYVGFSHLYSADAIGKEDLLGAYLEDVAERGIVVNRDGDRFVDEGLGRRIISSIMTKISIYIQGWIIIDEAIYSKPRVREKVDDVIEFGGTVHTADTIEELARKARISPRLSQTVSEFNMAVGEGKTAELRIPRAKMIYQLRWVPWPPPTENLGGESVSKIFTPPFYAIPFVPGIVATYGGFLITPKCEVLNWDKKPIPGLYAAGLTMEGSLSGGVENKMSAYVGCLATCLIFGILAAENAVKAYQRF